MSYRIETVEELKNDGLVEKVLDRLRRTTRPRDFVFKVRCKILGNKPVLITAPPGRKIKSSLIRQIRLGTKTLKGTVRREEKILFFQFHSVVDKALVARWLHYCLHKAKAPVPLQHIVIECPNEDKNKDKKRKNKSQAQIETPPTIETNIVDINWEQNDIQPDDDNEEQEIENIHQALINKDRDALIEQMMLVDPLLKEHLPTYQFSALLKSRREMEQQELKVEDLLEFETNLLFYQEDAQVKISSIMQKQEIIQQKLHNTDWQKNIVAWKNLLSTIFNSDMQLDSFRDILSQTTLPTEKLQRELQFITDDWEAYRAIKEYCSIAIEREEKAPEDYQDQYNTLEAEKISLYARQSKRETRYQQLQEKILRNQQRLKQKQDEYWKQQRNALLNTAQRIVPDSQSEEDLYQELAISTIPAHKELLIALQNT